MPETAEAVALALLEKIAGNEDWGVGSWRAPSINRTKILDTYAECLEAVRGKRAKEMSLLESALRPRAS